MTCGCGGHADDHAIRIPALRPSGAGTAPSGFIDLGGLYHEAQTTGHASTDGETHAACVCGGVVIACHAVLLAPATVTPIAAPQVVNPLPEVQAWPLVGTKLVAWHTLGGGTCGRLSSRPVAPRGPLAVAAIVAGNRRANVIQIVHQAG